MPFDILKFAESFGGPTLIAVLVILRLERRLDRLADAILGLPAAIANRACTAPPDQCPFKERPQ